MDEQRDSSLGRALSHFAPMQVFVFGLVGGILVLCTIGFFILLSMMLEGESLGSFADRDDAPAREQQVGGAPAAQVSIPEVTRDDHIRGDEDADITIVEYSDLECPFCNRFHETMKQVVDEFDGKVNWVYRHFPLTSIHPRATKLAVATECAGEQDKFWEMSDAIFSSHGTGASYDDASITSFAREAGVRNINKFTQCLSSDKYNDLVGKQARDAQAAGARGTPYSIILGPNGEAIPLNGAQPFAAVQAALQQLGA